VCHNTTPDLQDQVQDYRVQDRDRFFSSETGLVLRLTVSDRITGIHTDYIYIAVQVTWPDWMTTEPGIAEN